MESNYTIKDLIALFLSKLWLIIIAALVGGAAAFSVSKFLMPLEYSSHIAMYVQSYTEVAENANLNNNISNSKQLVNTYIEVLKDDAVINAVGNMLSREFDENTLQNNFSISNGRISPSSLRSCITISSVTDTSALKVTATTHNAEISAAICNDLSSVAPRYLREAVGVGSINTIDTAKVYYTPVAPNTPKNTLLGAAAGFMLMILLILMVDFFDNTVKETDSLENKYNKAIIGEIQQFGKDKKKKSTGGTKRFKLTDPDLPFAITESYKSIRTNITFSLSTFDKKVFAVSSPNPGEGKSTIAANIAIALAQSGSKVLLIDADLRRNVAHHIFDVKNEKGLSTVISKQAELQECIRPTEIENLDIMTAGEVPPNPSELLGSAQMHDILEKLTKQYSTVIIDTPPVNVVTDAMEIAKSVSGIIMVVRYAKTTTDDIEAAMKKIEFAQMHLLGFILNGVDTKHHGKYYSKYKYGYYNKYYGKTKKPENKQVKK